MMYLNALRGFCSLLPYPTCAWVFNVMSWPVIRFMMWRWYRQK
jgi:hypothetical protein